MQKKPFTELGLSPELLKAVAKMGFEEASPIQSATIPALMEGKDVVGQSQTGSGKTAAFAIPALEKVDPMLRAPQVLILCPTRELAVQVAEEVAKLAFFKPRVRELPIYGGASYERQFRGLQAGAQVIIGTPGRVIDHLERKSLKLDAVKMVILDECDRMLDMGFADDIEKILEQTPPERQSVFFSATLPQPIRRLIQRFSKEPQHIQITSETATVPTIDQTYYEVGRSSKGEVLGRLIDLHDFKYGIIFCATKMMVDELTEQLSARGYMADKLHGDMSQMMRERVMRRFRDRRIEFLVATDVAARGLDVDDIEVVFNYDLPNDPEDYVHRIGRTGRAGRAGRAITFVAGRETYKVQAIQRFTKSRIRRENVPTPGEVEEKRSTAFFDTLRETLEKGEYRRQDDVVDRLLDQNYTPGDIVSALLHLLADDKARPAEPIPEDRPRRAPGDYPKYESAGPARRSAPARNPQGDRNLPARRMEGEAVSPPRAAEAPAAPQSASKAGEPSRPNSGKEHLPKPPPRRAPDAAEDYRARRAPRDFPDEHRGFPDDRRSGFVAPEEGMARLRFNAGEEHGIGPGDVFGVIVGAADLPREAVGTIRLQPRHTFVEVAEEHAETALRKLNGIRFKGRKLIVVPAGGGAGDEDDGRPAKARSRPPRF